MRVFVTGVGAVSALGATAGATMDRLLAGDRGISELSLFALPGAKSRLAAEVRGLDANDVFVAGADVSRTDVMAVVAAREALAQARLSTRESVVDVILGGTTAGMFETEELLTRLGSQSSEALDGVIGERLRTHPLSSTIDKLCSTIGPFRVARTVCCACTSGAAAVALAVAWLRTGRSEIVLAGGADALCRLTFSGFGALSVLDPQAARPFDTTRAGLSLGEGAGMLVIETERSARARGARLLAEVAGVAMGGEGHHITNPEPGGATAAKIMSSAITSAGMTIRDVGYINAHGTGTPQNDSNEASAISKCFGEVRVPVSSSKGQIGHTLGAAGALEAVIGVLALERSQLPPTIGLSDPDPACDLEHVRASRSEPGLEVVMSNSFGFGGTGASLVLAKPDRRPPAPSDSEIEARRTVVVTGIAVVAPQGLVSGAEVGRLMALEGEAKEANEATEPASNVDATTDLDAGKARRMDRAGRLSAAVLKTALDDADRSAERPIDRRGVAALSGTAFGSVDGSMRFMKRVLEKGAGFASPADFPNLVPSSPVSHASIYLGLGGPAIATPDLSATAESAILTGVELIESGQSEAAVAGSVEEVSQLAERVLAPLLGMRRLTAHSEGASAVVLEWIDAARGRGAKILARIAFSETRRTPSPNAGGVLERVPAPVRGALIISEPAVDWASVVSGTSWEGTRAITTSEASGDHVGAGGVAFAGAAALISRGHAPQALVIGAAPGRIYAFVLERVDEGRA